MLYLTLAVIIYELAVIFGFLLELAKGDSSLLCFSCDFREQYKKVERCGAMGMHASLRSQGQKFADNRVFLV